MPRTKKIKPPKQIPEVWTCMRCLRVKKAVKRWPKPADMVCSRCRSIAREKIVRGLLKDTPILLNETQVMLAELGAAVGVDTLKWVLKDTEKWDRVYAKNERNLAELTTLKPRVFMIVTPKSPKSMPQVQTSAHGDGLIRFTPQSEEGKTGVK